MSNFMLEIGAHLSRHPKNLLVLLLSLMVSAMAFPSFVFGLLISLLLPTRRVSYLWINVLLVALLLMVLAIDNRSLLSICITNINYLILLIQNEFIFLNDYAWDIICLILSILYAGLLTMIRSMDNELVDTLKQVGKGRINITRYLSPRAMNKALACLYSANRSFGTVLGINRETGKPVFLTDQQANCHTLAIGTTGSGKTTGICNIIESAIERQFPVIIVDGKGDLELAHRVEAFAHARQTKTYVFSMVGRSVRYNPIADGGITSKKDRIIALRQWSEEHYRKIAEGYLQTVFYVLEKSKITIDLNTLACYMNPKSLAQLAQPLQDSQINQRIKLLIQQESQILSLKAEIENLTQSEIGHLFKCDTGEVLTLERALQENAVVYFCLQPLAFPSYAEGLGRLIINDLKYLAAQQINRRDQKKIYTLFDEFSVFAGEQIVHLINQGRSAGIHAVLATQSLSDLRRTDDHLVGQILNNCNNYIIQRQNDPDDAETLARIIGTKNGFTVTSQISTQNSHVSMGSARSTKEFIVHPDELKRLAFGEAIIVNKISFTVQRIQLRKSLVV